jgi:hypothetical protein
MRNKLIVGFIVFLGIVIVYSYMYPDHRTISEEIVSFNVQADSIFNEFIDDATQAESKYLDQTIVVSGLITSVNVENVTINNKIYCQFESLNNDLKVNDSVAIKGRCIGFDDLLEEIKLDQCSIIK